MSVKFSRQHRKTPTSSSDVSVGAASSAAASVIPSAPPNSVSSSQGLAGVPSRVSSRTSSSYVSNKSASPLASLRVLPTHDVSDTRPLIGVPAPPTPVRSKTKPATSEIRIVPIPLGRAARKENRPAPTKLTRGQLRPSSPKMPRPNRRSASPPTQFQKPPRLPSLANMQAPQATIRGQSFSIAAERFVASGGVPKERQHVRYVREMLFEGLFIVFMIALVLVVAYFLVYYVGYGELMKKNGLDLFHQWFAHWFA